jgi:hypothetical protein
MAVLKVSWCGIRRDHGRGAAVPGAGGDGAVGRGGGGGGRGGVGVISDCHFSVQLNHFVPGFLSYSVPVL